jgi:hypothetical protein
VAFASISGTTPDREADIQTGYIYEYKPLALPFRMIIVKRQAYELDKVISHLN